MNGAGNTGTLRGQNYLDCVAISRDWLPVPAFRAQTAARQSADRALPPNSADSHIIHPFPSSSAFLGRKYFQMNFSRLVRIAQDGSSNRIFSATLDDVGGFPRVLMRLRGEL